MFKKSIVYPIGFFAGSILWQVSTGKEVDWSGNFWISFIILLIVLIHNWSKVPYEWKKDKTHS